VSPHKIAKKGLVNHVPAAKNVGTSRRAVGSTIVYELPKNIVIVVWDAFTAASVITDVSEEHIASIFRVKRLLSLPRSE
jgi:hypothetical protein